MDEQDEIPRNYKWPWFVLAAAILFVMLAVVFVGFKARQIEHERDFSAPMQSVGK
jgi:bacteriorhodopsin